LVFTYDTTGDYQYLCRSVESPSGFTVSYSYTDGLLTGISKSNGQVLSYAYDKVTDAFKTKGWLTKVTYANAAEVEITYGDFQKFVGAGGNSFSVITDKKVASVKGPEGYEHIYDYAEMPSNVTSGTNYYLTDKTTLTDSLDRETSFYNSTGFKRVHDALGYNQDLVKTAEQIPLSVTDGRGKTTTFTYHFFQ